MHERTTRPAKPTRRAVWGRLFAVGAAPYNAHARFLVIRYR